MNPLFALRERLREQGAATASQLALVLHLPRATVEDMLAYWQRRGRVEAVALGAAGNCGPACSGGQCGSCGAAPAAELRVYRWRESDPRTPQLAS